MASRNYALIDGNSRKNFDGGNTNMAFWDDPSYHNPASKLSGNSDAFKDSVVSQELIEPQKFDKPYLSHEEITRVVSKQFASDIKERSFASDSVGCTGFALVFVVSLLPAMGIMDVITYAQMRDEPRITCLRPTTYAALLPAAWIWITAGIWCSLAPMALGMLLVFSKQSSNADYTHTFDPVLRDDGRNGKTKSSEKTYNILTIISIISLVLGFICGVIDAVVFNECLATNFIIKFVPPLVVCIGAVIVIVLIVLQLRARKKQSRQNSNYDRRNYDITLNHGLYRPTGDGVKRTIQMEAQPLPVANFVPQQNQPLVTIIDQAPVYPVIAPPPPPPRPIMGPPIFAGASRLPVRGARYQRPMFYQMPGYNY